MFGGSENPLREIMMRLFPLPDFLHDTKAQPWVPPWDAGQAPSPSPAPDQKRGRGESYYRDKLALAERGEIEVSIPGGRIDVLTSTEVIEVKSARNWMHALGQVQVYGSHFPRLRKRIHLFGELTVPLKDIEQHCRRLGVRVTWEPA
jgi:hypothetical protein